MKEKKRKKVRASGGITFNVPYVIAKLYNNFKRYQEILSLFLIQFFNLKLNGSINKIIKAFSLKVNLMIKHFYFNRYITCYLKQIKNQVNISLYTEIKLL